VLLTSARVCVVHQLVMSSADSDHKYPTARSISGTIPRIYLLGACRGCCLKYPQASVCVMTMKIAKTLSSCSHYAETNQRG
jgi:hypothetical protein